MSAGGAVAAVRGRIIRCFAKANAFSEETAICGEALGRRRRFGMFKRMEKRSVIIETGDGRYYMNKAFYDAHMKRVRIVLPIALAIFFVISVYYLLVWLVVSSR